MKTYSWFSAGVSSAVATKLLIDEIDEIFYIHIDDQHEDSMRFVKDCEEWFGKPVTIMQSHFKSVDDVCRSRSYLVGPGGAPCTMVLKKNVRKLWESRNPGAKRYVWGMDYSEREQNRADKLIDNMQTFDHVFPLIDNRMTKQMAHEVLKASGIKRPHLYSLGFENNNCIACVKGGAAYFNLVREHFPEEFQKRAELERHIGATCLKKNIDGETVRIYLDELDPKAGRGMRPIVDDCGILCEVLAI